MNNSNFLSRTIVEVWRIVGPFFPVDGGASLRLILSHSRFRIAKFDPREARNISLSLKLGVTHECDGRTDIVIADVARHHYIARPESKVLRRATWARRTALSSVSHSPQPAYTARPHIHT